MLLFARRNLIITSSLAQRDEWRWSHPSFSYHKYKDGLFQPCRVRVRVHHHLPCVESCPAWPAFLECRIAGIILDRRTRTIISGESVREAPRTVHLTSWSSSFTSHPSNTTKKTVAWLHLGPCPGIDALLLFTKDMLWNDPAMMSLQHQSRGKTKQDFRTLPLAPLHMHDCACLCILLRE